MVAMKNASDNATEIISDLTLNFNKQRQAKITSRIIRKYYGNFYCCLNEFMPQKYQGTITRIIGPVIDVHFPQNLPPIYAALKLKFKQKEYTLEVQQHLGGGVIRSICLGPTDGLTRHLPVESDGLPISVPIGEATLGRMFNVIGEPIDGKGDGQNHPN